VAFTRESLAETSKHLDFLNVMTYDFFGRRENITTHHTGIKNSLIAIDTYLTNGVPADKVNLGFAFYVKWFRTDPHGGCVHNPLGCKTVQMEDPKTGEDLGMCGAFSWHDKVPEELEKSFYKAVPNAQWDDDGNYYWDSDENIFWSWDTPASIAAKFPAIVQSRKLGGVFAWGLGEDADAFLHLRTLKAAYKKYFRPYVVLFLTSIHTDLDPESPKSPVQSKTSFELRLEDGLERRQAISLDESKALTIGCFQLC
jgi:GH18 family chitinase